MALQPLIRDAFSRSDMAGGRGEDSDYAEIADVDVRLCITAHHTV